MTQKINKSAMAGIPDFGPRVAAHAHEMRQWRAQMKNAAEHKVNPPAAAIDMYVERPMPREDHVVESAVNEKDEADFEIVDDGPTPTQMLQAKKNALLHKLAQAEHEAGVAIFPNGKRRMAGLRRENIEAADKARIDKLIQELKSFGLVDKVLKRHVEVVEKLKDPDKLHAQERPPEDHAFMVEQNQVQQKLRSLMRWGAQVMSDIEDLTIDNVDAWIMPDLPA
jgi:hypothetical protein